MCNDPTCPYGELATDDTVLMQVHGYDIREPWQGAPHIALNDPVTVLRRCEADRRILARHRVNPADVDSHWYATACMGCGATGDCDDPVTENVSDCPELLDLAYAHGITDDILAGLDRPQPPKPSPARQRRLRQLAKQRISLTPPITTSDVPAALRGPRWKP